jgi:hypothetical protein
MGMAFGLVVLAGAGIALGWWLASARRKRLATWAAANGLRFESGADRQFAAAHPGFGCLSRGHSRCAYNVAEGSRNGRSITAFDYRYVTGHGKSRSVRRFSAVILGSTIALRPLRIRPESVLDRVAEAFGIDDIDFESVEFSRSFHVRAADRRWAYGVLHQRTIEFLLSMPRFSIQLTEKEMIVWRDRRFDPETFDDAIRVAEGVLDRLPGYVVREGGGE